MSVFLPFAGVNRQVSIIILMGYANFISQKSLFLVHLFCRLITLFPPPLRFGRTRHRNGCPFGATAQRRIRIIYEMGGYQWKLIELKKGL